MTRPKPWTTVKALRFTVQDGVTIATLALAQNQVEMLNMQFQLQYTLITIAKQKVAEKTFPEEILLGNFCTKRFKFENVGIKNRPKVIRIRFKLARTLQQHIEHLHLYHASVCLCRFMRSSTC